MWHFDFLNSVSEHRGFSPRAFVSIALWCLVFWFGEGSIIVLGSYELWVVFSGGWYLALRQTAMMPLFWFGEGSVMVLGSYELWDVVCFWWALSCFETNHGRYLGQLRVCKCEINQSNRSKSKTNGLCVFFFVLNVTFSFVVCLNGLRCGFSLLFESTTVRSRILYMYPFIVLLSRSRFPRRKTTAWFFFFLF